MKGSRKRVRGKGKASEGGSVYSELEADGGTDGRTGGRRVERKPGAIGSECLVGRGKWNPPSLSSEVDRVAPKTTSSAV